MENEINLKVGDKYKMDLNPFDVREVEIVDIKQGYIQYKDKYGSTLNNSMTFAQFLCCYPIKVKSE
jgi:hypothetical protein